MSGELRGPGDALLDEGLAGFTARGLGTVTGWRARIKDDDGRVWRAAGDAVDALTWRGPGAVAALRSLRPVSIEVRAEGADGGAASRTVVRRVLGDGVVVRRWREKAMAATLFRPPAPSSACVVDGGEGEAGDALTVCCALLASRGVLVLHVGGGRERALELLRTVPGGEAPVPRDALPLAPGIPATAPGDAAAWDAVLRELGATERSGAGP